MLRRLYIDNYKCLVNFEVNLGHLALLLGPNGAGKSATFDLLFALRQLLAGKAKVTDEGVFPTRSLTRWDTRDRQVIELGVTLNEDALTYRLEIEHERDTRRARIALERLAATSTTLFEFKDGQAHLYDDRGKLGAHFPADWSESFLARTVPRQENKRLTRFLEFMRKMVVCGIYPRSLSTESSTEEPTLARDGSNFASWYRHVLQEHPDLVPSFTSALSEVVDGFKAIRLEKVGTETRVLGIMFGRPKAYETRLDEISDGQRALMVLYALLHFTSDQGYTLVLDEPDNYVSLAEIQPWLVGLADACGEGTLQAILSSHHPELIDYLGASHGLLLERQDGGPATIRRVDETAETQAGLRLSEIVARGWTPP